MTQIEKSAANIYADLGIPDAEAMHVKAALAAKIGHIITHRQLTQIEAAAVLGMTQPKLSGLLRGQFRGISESKMIDCLNRLGRDVEIVIGKGNSDNDSTGTGASRPGQTRVVLA
jgi:predicted XRE-type DNA-binding protein